MAYDFVIGMDVGKYFHHACVLDAQGNQVLSKPLKPARRLATQALRQIPGQ